MNLLTKALNKIFRSGNQQELNKIQPIIAKINDLEKNYIDFSPEDFAQKTAELKKNISLILKKSICALSIKNILLILLQT